MITLAPRKGKKEKLFSVTLKDCRVDTFRAGGKGGQAQNKLETGVRVVHVPSGAVGEARDSASQYDNKKNAFRRMTQDPKFDLWIRLRTTDMSQAIDKAVKEQMHPRNIKTEFYDPSA